MDDTIQRGIWSSGTLLLNLDMAKWQVQPVLRVAALEMGSLSWNRAQFSAMGAKARALGATSPDAKSCSHAPATTTVTVRPLPQQPAIGAVPPECAHEPDPWRRLVNAVNTSC